MPRVPPYHCLLLPGIAAFLLHDHGHELEESICGEVTMIKHLPRSGMSLIELLVVIGIIGSLIALSLPAVQRVRDSANRMVCQDHLRQLGLALQAYHEVYQSLPAGCSYRGGADPYPHMSWCTRLLPFLEQEAIWREVQKAFGEEKLFFINPPHTHLATVTPVFTCPSDSRTLSPSNGPRMVAFTAYLGIEGTNQISRDGVLFLDSRVRFTDIRDGTSNTLMIGERPPSSDGVFGWWYGGWGQSQDGSADMVLGVREVNVGTYGANCPPGPYNFGPGRVSDQFAAFHFRSLHIGGGANFLFADGSVHFLPYTTDSIMPGLATRSGGEPIAPPF